MKRGVLLLCLCALVASGCSLGPREHWAEAIREAYDRLADGPPVLVRHAAVIEVIETTIRQEPKPLIAHGTGVADFAAHRARLVESADRNAEVIYDDLVVFAQRSESSIGVSEEPWAAFDFEREPSVDLDDNDRRLAVGAGFISPVLAVELLDGVLTGSITDAGTESKDGIETSRYSAKLAPDAAVTKLEDEDRQDGVERLFATLGVQQDNFPVDVWIDAEGRIRALRYVMRQQKDRVNAFELRLDWVFGDDAPSGTIEVPSAGDTLRSGRFADFVTEVIREFG